MTRKKLWNNVLIKPASDSTNIKPDINRIHKTLNEIGFLKPETGKSSSENSNQRFGGTVREKFFYLTLINIQLHQIWR